MTNHLVVQDLTRKTTRFVVAFAVLLAGVVVVLDLIVLWLFDAPAFGAHNLIFVAAVLCALAACWGWRFSRLAGSGPDVARMLGGQRISPTTTVADEQRFCNVAQEVALAAGIPVPSLFVLAEDQSLNAIAVGDQGQGSAVCVSAGALQRFSRSELQGVVAHEIAHLTQGDTRLARMLISGIFALSCISSLGAFLVLAPWNESDPKTKEGEGGKVLIALSGLALMAIGALGVLAASLLDAATSRRMELRADAEATRLLCDSSGLVSALRKLWLEADAPVGDVRPKEALPLHWRATAARYWFDTHPPLLERIRALDPAAAEMLLARG